MHIAIVGAGTMGTGIAQAVALGGDQIILYDIEDAILRRALSRISRGLDQGAKLGKADPGRVRQAKRAFRLAPDLAKCALADVVIEAVPDDLALKQSVFQALDNIVKSNTILASCTNTLSITALAAATRSPERVIGLHFCNPAHIMRLVEVVRGEDTRQDVIDRAISLVRQIGKTPVLVRDTPGWVVNRIAQAYYGEALRLLDDSNLDVQSIDRLLEAAGFPMGPFRLMDFLGIDTTFDVARALFEETFQNAPYPPHARQQRLIQAGRLGRKSGKGFYNSR